MEMRCEFTIEKRQQQEDEDGRKDYISVIPQTLQEKLLMMRWQDEGMTHDFQDVKILKITSS